jgi:MarR family.
MVTINKLTVSRRVSKIFKGNHLISNKEIVNQLINIAVRHRRIMQNYLDETGVYQSQHRLLMEIAHNPNAFQKDIAKSMDVSAATIAVSLKKLEKGGYISREIDETDNRLNKITITEKGNGVVEKSRKIFEAANEQIFRGFSDEEKSVLFNLLIKLNNNLIRMEEDIKLKRGRDIAE